MRQRLLRLTSAPCTLKPLPLSRPWSSPASNASFLQFREPEPYINRPLGQKTRVRPVSNLTRLG
jgi:hypothetical protein